MLESASPYNTGVIIFYLVWFLYKKNNETDFFFKKTETELKPVQTGLTRFFFPVFLRFGFSSVRFGFFSFRLIKPKQNRTGRFFFKILIGLISFFFMFGFFGYFFSGFLGLISFSVFLLTPSIMHTNRLHIHSFSFSPLHLSFVSFYPLV